MSEEFKPGPDQDTLGETQQDRSDGPVYIQKLPTQPAETGSPANTLGEAPLDVNSSGYEPKLGSSTAQEQPVVASVDWTVTPKHEDK